jgi:pimeloyl-ACP methyl ester carboxylesterase
VKTESAPITRSTQVVRCPDGLPMTLDVFRPVGAGAPLPVTVICHGFKGFRLWGLFPPLAARLAAGGRATALFDFSHNGTSGAVDFDRLDLFERQTPGRHVADLRAVLKVLSGERLARRLGLREGGEVAVAGHSLGGGVAVLAAAADERITRLATLNGVSHLRRIQGEALEELERVGHVTVHNGRTGQDMPLGRAWFEGVERTDVEAAARALSIPALVVQGAEDPNVTPDEGAALAEWIDGARLVSVPGADHTFGARHPWAGWTDPLEQVVAELDAFLPALGEGAP